MKYATLQLETRGEWQRLAAAEQTRRVTNHGQIMNALLAARLRSGPSGLVFAAAGLRTDPGAAVTVKKEHGRSLCMDGPFPETKEGINGFTIIEFDSRHDAIAFARNEHTHDSHVSELRPIRDFWWISQTSGPVAPKVFMLTFTDDERATRDRSESERKQVRRHHQGIAAEYAAQTNVHDQ